MAAVVDQTASDDAGLHIESHDLDALERSAGAFFQKGSSAFADPALAALEASHMCGEKHRKIAPAASMRPTPDSSSHARDMAALQGAARLQTRAGSAQEDRAIIWRRAGAFATSGQP
jgi:hypothetical protein